MRRHYGSHDRAKREIFARYASFIYLGNGRYGFAAGSEYYFGKPLSSYGPEDAGQAAVLAGIMKSPRDYAPVPGDPRPLRRRNQILALMARNGYIPEDLAKRSQAEPIRVATAQRGEDPRPRGDRARLRRAEAPRRRALRGRGLGAGADLGPLHGGRAGPDHRQRGPGDRPRALRAAPPEAKGLIQGSVVVLRNADGAILAEAGGRQVYQDRYTRYSDYNRVTGSRRQPGSAFKPLLYLAAFRQGLDLDTTVPDEPIGVPLGANGGVKWITNYDNRFRVRSPFARRWPSRATRWPSGSPGRSAWTR